MPSESEALVRRVLHEGSAVPNPRAVLDELLAVTSAAPGRPGLEHDHGGGSYGIETCVFNDAFSGLSFTVQSISTEADRVVARFSASGRQVAEFQDVPAADRDVTLSGITTFLIEQGKIIEGWGSLSWG